jgi:hypothetical protein
MPVATRALAPGSSEIRSFPNAEWSFWSGIIGCTGALRIEDIALGSANAELYNMIGQQVKAGSRFHNTVVVTLTNGMANSGYVPTDDAFGRFTFQVLGSSLKPGCAEAAIVRGIDDMLHKME